MKSQLKSMKFPINPYCFWGFEPEVSPHSPFFEALGAEMTLPAVKYIAQKIRPNGTP